ncbi:MAG TPA: hypothetical protein VK787_03350 [Puia sp.]|nr:hypothetical protein [Puia sp.]
MQKAIKNDSSADVNTILFADPQVIDSSHIVIYPLILEKTTYGSGFSSGSGERTNYWNLLFFNTETNQQHLLSSDKKIVIFSINTGESSSSSRDTWIDRIDVYKDNIFYEVIAKDYNQNNYLDDNDPTYLFISDKQGNNFKQLSPEDYNIKSWTVVKGTTKIILQAQKDNNNDKKFDAADKVVPMMVDVTSGKIAQETFNQNYIDSLKSIMTKVWKTERK